MIYSLAGKLEAKGTNYVVVGAHGIGFKVFVPRRVKFPKLGSRVKLFTYLYIREETAELYGFFGEDELSLFGVLVSVSGIGPKLALSLLSIASASRLATAIKKGDADLLRKSSGIGRKTAERLIVELKDKIKSSTGEDVELIERDQDVFEALVALGYTRKEARGAIEKINPKSLSLGDRLKDALKKVR